MSKNQYTKTAIRISIEAIAGKLQRHFGREVADASKEQGLRGLRARRARCAHRAYD